MVFDEIDHLGAYVSRNRFDQDIREHLENADLVAWDSFCEVVDRFFEKENWATEIVPRQHYPAELEEVLKVLDNARPPGWLRADASIRDLNGEAREELANIIRSLRLTLKHFPFRRFLFGSDRPIQVWLLRSGASPGESEITRNGEIACLMTGSPNIIVLLLEYYDSAAVRKLQVRVVKKPSILRMDYSRLKHEAEIQRRSSTKKQ